MAVTKIRKISSWTLLISMIVSIVILGLFYFGGVVPGTEGAENKEPAFTGLLLNWTYALFFVTIVAAFLFAIGQFVSTLKVAPKSAMSSLVVLVLFVAMLFVTYVMGDSTPMQGLNEDSQIYNTPFWLQITDMWIYSTYVLVILIIVAAIAGSVKKMLNK